MRTNAQASTIAQPQKTKEDGMGVDQNTSQSASTEASTEAQPQDTEEGEMDIDQNTSRSATTEASTNAQPQKMEEREVCADTITPELTLNQAVTQDCTHSAKIAICKACVGHHIRVQIDSMGWDSISCPVQGCRSIFKYNDLQNMAFIADFERYDAHLFQRAIDKESSSDYRKCASPNCAGGGWCNPEMESFMTCSACGHRTCIACEVTWHSEKTCEEHKEDVRTQTEEADAEIKAAAARIVAETQSAKYIQANSKACPNKSCGYRIDRTTGCNHMTCSKCRYQFCWLCLADWERIRQEGNTAHQPDCKDHTDQIARREDVRAFRDDLWAD